MKERKRRLKASVCFKTSNKKERGERESYLLVSGQPFVMPSILLSERIALSMSSSYSAQQCSGHPNTRPPRFPSVNFLSRRLDFPAKSNSKAVPTLNLYCFPRTSTSLKSDSTRFFSVGPAVDSFFSAVSRRFLHRLLHAFGGFWSLLARNLAAVSG